MALCGLKSVTGIVTWTLVVSVVMADGTYDRPQNASRFLEVAISRLRNITHLCDDELSELHNALDTYNAPASYEQGCHVMTRTLVCYGDEDCETYGSCCLYRVPVKPSHPDMDCLSHSGRSIYMLNSCPKGWKGGYVRRMCERQNTAAAAQPFTWLPVTSRVTNLTYSNYYCALCRGDSEQYALWAPTVQCHIPEAGLPSPNASYIWKHLQREDEQWGVYIKSANKSVNKGTIFYQCNLDFKPNGLPTVACGEVDQCDSVMSIVGKASCKVDWGFYYKRNCTGVNCHLCDTARCGVITSTLTPEYDGRVLSPNQTALFVLDTRGNDTSDAVGAQQRCRQCEVWSPFYDGKCLNVNCSRLMLTVLSRYLPEFDMMASSVLRHLSTFCSFVSMICLVLHICAFLVGAIERNLPAMCVTSMAVCYLILFFYDAAFKKPEPGTLSCQLMPIFTLTLQEASLFWTNVMGFDLFMTLRRANSDLRVVRGPRLRRFACYTLCVWTLIAAIVGTAVLMDHIPGVPEEYRPGFGRQDFCWPRILPVLIFFTAPVFVAAAIDMVLFVAIARLIRRMRATSAESSNQSHKQLRLFCRLAVMMGLVWIYYILTVLSTSWALMSTCFLLYAAQGIFIFASFTITRSSRAWLRRRMPTCGRILCERLCRCLRNGGNSFELGGGTYSAEAARHSDNTGGTGHTECTRTTQV